MPEDQLDMFDDELPRSFHQYDTDHPQIWKKFEEVAFQTASKGFEHYSAKGIFEIIRWHTGVNAEFPNGFKVNNNYTPYYARKFAKLHQEHAEFFRKRRSKFDHTLN